MFVNITEYKAILPLPNFDGLKKRTRLCKIHKIMLPGDYIAMRLTGTIQTTVSGLSEDVVGFCTQNLQKYC